MLVELHRPSRVWKCRATNIGCALVLCNGQGASTLRLHHVKVLFAAQRELLPRHYVPRLGPQLVVLKPPFDIDPNVFINAVSIFLCGSEGDSLLVARSKQ